MNEFLALVKERPDPSLTMEHICPFCDSKDIQDQGYSTTLLGGGSNHRWYNCQCNGCNKKFMHEVKESHGYREEELLDGARHWYTCGGKILKGIPACYESYIYTCKYCSGDVLRKYINDDGSEATVISYRIEDGKSICEQSIIFECQGCSKKIESSNDRYQW